MNATLTLPNRSQTSVSERRMLGMLQDARFTLQADGWFYPEGVIDRAAVRLAVHGGQYRLQRRRKLNTAWIDIVVADTSEFDPAAFRVWQDSWPLNF